ncbi:MAG: ATP-binding cassette domain-containing protein, partial [Natronospirillum sp.]
ALAHHQDQLLAQDDAVHAQQRQLAQRIAWANALGTFGTQAAVALTLLVALAAFQAGWFSGPVAVMLPLAVMALAEAFAALPKAFAHAGGTVAAAERLNEQAEAAPPTAEPTESAFSSHQPLHWHQVSVLYGDYWALQDVSLTLSPGTRLGIIGPSGSGKSTLAALAARLQRPDYGQLLLGDTPLSHLDADVWRTQLGYLTQHSDLFNETLRTNLWLGNPDATEAQLWQALDIVAFADAVRAFPNQLDTRVGEGGRQLSGGETRRIALARVILKDPPWVILDEPFSGLDTATADRIRMHLEPWMKGRTLLALGHEAAALPVVDRVVTL